MVLQVHIGAASRAQQDAGIYARYSHKHHLQVRSGMSGWQTNSAGKLSGRLISLDKAGYQELHKPVLSEARTRGAFLFASGTLQRVSSLKAAWRGRGGGLLLHTRWWGGWSWVRWLFVYVASQSVLRRLSCRSRQRIDPVASGGGERRGGGHWV